MDILIISGGAIDEAFALDFLSKKPFHQVIVADSGLAFAHRAKKAGLNLNLTHLVGDFDSVDPYILKQYKADSKIEVREFRPEKDYTDTDIAVKTAIKLIQENQKKGTDREGDATPEICILGALGTRQDHALANIGLLLQPYSEGIEACIIDPWNKLTIIEDSYMISKSAQFGNYISLIPLSPQIKDITLTGFKYPLLHRDVVMGESLCVSNEIVDNVASIAIGEGKMLLVQSRD